MDPGVSDAGLKGSAPCEGCSSLAVGSGDSSSSDSIGRAILQAPGGSCDWPISTRKKQTIGTISRYGCET